MKRIGFILLLGISRVFAQSGWEPDRRLTYDTSISTLSFNNAHCLRAIDDTIHLVFSDTRDGNAEIYYKRSDDGGTNWGNDTRLTNALGISWYPSLAIRQSGLHVVWGDNRDGNDEIYYKRSTDGGLTWQSDIRLSNSAQRSWNSDIIVDSNDFVHVMWQDQRDGNGEIYYRRSTDGGSSWGQEIRFTNSIRESERATLAVNNQNTLHVAWYDWRDNPSRAEVYYARSTDGGANWSAQISLTNDSLSSGLPSITSDENNGIHIVYFYGTKNVSGDVYYLRSTDNGISWQARVKMTTTTTSSIFFPSITTDSGQGLHLVWQDTLSGNNEIYYKESTDRGMTWQNTICLTNNDSNSTTPFISADEAGRIHVVWEDSRDGNREIYYKRRPPGTGLDDLKGNLTKNNGFYLGSNYPNPFCQKTKISFSIPTAGFVTLRVFDVTGRKIMTQINENLASGYHKVEIDMAGKASGIFFYQLKFGTMHLTRKFLFRG